VRRERGDRGVETLRKGRRGGREQDDDVEAAAQAGLERRAVEALGEAGRRAEGGDTRAG